MVRTEHRGKITDVYLRGFLSHFARLSCVSVSTDKAMPQKQINPDVAEAKQQNYLTSLYQSPVQLVWVVGYFIWSLRNPGSFHHRTPPFLIHGLHMLRKTREKSIM